MALPGSRFTTSRYHSRPSGTSLRRLHVNGVDSASSSIRRLPGGICPLWCPVRSRQPRAGIRGSKHRHGTRHNSGAVHWGTRNFHCSHVCPSNFTRLHRRWWARRFFSFNIDTNRFQATRIVRVEHVTGECSSIPNNSRLTPNSHWDLWRHNYELWERNAGIFSSAAWNTKKIVWFRYSTFIEYMSG